MKLRLFVFVLTSIIGVPSYAGVTCLYKDSASVTTPDRNCSSSCKRWADIQPVETLKLTTDKKGSFLKNPTVRCEGGNGCRYISIGKPAQSNQGRTIEVTYKTWSIPVKIILDADVCILE